MKKLRKCSASEIKKRAISLILALLILSLIMPIDTISATTTGFGLHGDLRYRDLGNSITIIGYNGQSSTVVIPNTINGKPVTAIGENRVTGYPPFSNNTTLVSITIPDSVTTIGNRAFFGCSNLTNVTLSNNLVSIDEYAFYNCKSLRSITIPNSVTSIGGSAFGGCSGLESITLSNSLVSIGSSAFIGCERLEGITLPGSLREIGSNVFGRCINLSYAVLEYGITSMPGSMFSQCANLTSVTIPTSVTSIGAWAFSRCTSLMSINIPLSVTSIGNYAFEQSSNLYDIHFESPTPPNIGVYAFRGIRSGARAIVPIGAIAYGADGKLWNGLVISATGESPPHIPVTGITGVPTTAIAGIPLTLTGTVSPSNATNRAIAWSVVSAGTTGATISGSTLRTTAAGTVTVRATIANGTTASANYTQTFTIIFTTTQTSDPFTMGEDNYRFVNEAKSFGYSPGYKIPLSIYLELFTPDDAGWLFKNLRAWNGSCYGFAATSYAFEVYKLRQSDYQFGISRTYDFTTPQNIANSALRRLIELYQVSQFIPSLSLTLDRNFNRLEELIAAANNEDGLMVAIRGSAGGHIVIAYGIDRISSTRYSLKIYDSNQPNNTALRLEIDLTRSGSNAWWFNSADTQYYNTRLGERISFIDGELVYNEVQRARVEKAGRIFGSAQLHVPINAEITNTHGVSVEDIDGAFRIIPLGILPLNPDGSDPNLPRTTDIWIVPYDEYIVVVDSDESATISVMDEDRVFSINLMTLDDSIKVDIGETIEIDGAVHGNITEYLEDGTELLIPITAVSSVDLMPGEMEVAEFTDVNTGDWFDDAVTSIASAGIAGGVGGRRFNPQGRLTVAELVTMLMRTQYGRMSGGSSWYAPYIEQAERDGIISASDNLQPSANITRAQASLIITRFIECHNPRWGKERVERMPSDMADVPEEYHAAVEKAYSWNIVSGDSSNRFNPQSTLTRAQAAQILYNYYSIVD